jgi:SecD/SecF fusion protein
MKKTLSTLMLVALLAGGMIVTDCSSGGETIRYTVEFAEEDMLKSLAGDKAEDPDFVNVLEKSLAIKRQFPDSTLVEIFYNAWERELPGTRLAKIFWSYENQGCIYHPLSNVEIFQCLRAGRDKIRELSVLIISSRLEGYGYRFVNRPSYSGRTRGYYEFDTARLDRIHFYLQDAKDTAAVTRLISTCGELAIYATYRLYESETLSQEEDTESLHKQREALDWEKPILCRVKQEECQEVLAVLNCAKAEGEGKVPANLIFAPGRLEPGENGLIPIFLLKTTEDGQSFLGGECIIDAKVVTREADGVKYPALVISLNTEGAKIFSRLTRDNIDRQLAILIDGVVYSAPIVNAEIFGGKFAIDGNLTVGETNILASILKSGPLPVSCRVVNISTNSSSGQGETGSEE